MKKRSSAVNKRSSTVNKCSSAVNIEQNAARRTRPAPSPAEVSAGKTAGQCRKIGASGSVTR